MESYAPRFTTAAAWAGTGSQIELEHEGRVKPDDVLMATATGEYLIVESVDGRVCRVKRGLAGTEPVDIRPGDEILVAGSVVGRNQPSS